MMERRDHATVRQLIMGLVVGVTLAVVTGLLSSYVTVQVLLQRVDQIQQTQTAQFQELSNRMDALADKQ